MNFTQTEGDPCLYVSRDDAETAIIAVYVNDILIAAKTDQQISEVKAAIAKRFKVKDMGKSHHFLGVKIVQNLKAGTIWLGQPAYSENMLRQFNRKDAKACKTPVNCSLRQVKSLQILIKSYINQQLVSYSICLLEQGLTLPLQ